MRCTARTVLFATPPAAAPVDGNARIIIFLANCLKFRKNEKNWLVFFVSKTCAPLSAKSSFMAVVQQSLQFPLSALFRITNAVGQSRNYAKYDASSPDADALLLVGEVDPVSAVVVEGAHVAHGLSEEVLDAAVRSKVGEFARELGDLKESLYTRMLLFFSWGGKRFRIDLDGELPGGYGGAVPRRYSEGEGQLVAIV